jgi:UDP-3-O-[3-hydroxymyristoyl] glucosamine N-acyltransferase
MKTSFRLKQIADHLQAAWSGDPDVTVSGIANLAHAEPHHLSFLSKKKYSSHLADTRAGIVIVQEDIAAPDRLNLVRVPDPYAAYAKISHFFCQRRRQAPGIHPSAVVHASAIVPASASVGPGCSIGESVVIGENTEIQPGVVIGNGSRLGDDCVIFPNVVIYHEVVLGDRVVVHSNTVIGADGFGFARDKEGWIKIHQLGGVRIGNDVEIGASTTIDRGAIDDTVIGDGVIIDNQVHIAHNCIIGRNTAIAGCVGMAGSTEIGANCTIGGMVGIGGHLKIADNVHFNGSTVVTKSIPSSGVYASGTAVQEVHTWRRNAVRFGQLDEWVEKIKALEKALYERADESSEKK